MAIKYLQCHVTAVHILRGTQSLTVLHSAKKHHKKSVEQTFDNAEALACHQRPSLSYFTSSQSLGMGYVEGLTKFNKKNQKVSTEKI